MSETPADVGLLQFRPREGLLLTGFADSEFIYKEIWEEHFYDKHYPIAPGSQVLDLGANQGFFAVYAASKGAQVYAYEPEPRAFQMLARNIDACCLGEAVRIHERAIAATAGQVDLIVPSSPDFSASGMATASVAFSTSLQRIVAHDTTTVRVRTETLAGVFDRYSDVVFDLLKIDCEGSELEILAGAPEGCSDRIRNLVIETHDNYPQERLFRAVQDLGFVVREFEKLAGRFRTGYLFASSVVGEPAPRVYSILKTEPFGLRGESRSFDASASFSASPRNPITRYTWTIDGAIVEDGDRPILEHAFERPGHYAICVKVADERGHVDHDCANVWIFEPDYFGLSDATPMPPIGSDLACDVVGSRTFVIDKQLFPRNWRPRRILIGITQPDRMVGGILRFNHLRLTFDDRHQEIPIHGIPAGLDVYFSIETKERASLKLAWWGSD